MDKSSGELQLLPKLANLQTTSTLPSFKVLPLGDLLEMFQDHEATDQRDKIYALLGLSSDNDISPDLHPDYTKNWSTLFHQVIVHVLGSSPTINTWNDKEQAVVSDLGCILGTITMGISNTISVIAPIFSGIGGAGYLWRASWQVPHHSGRVREGDFLCHLQGARRPSILRLCGDHFDVVMISLPPPPVVVIEQNPRSTDWEDSTLDWVEFIECVRHSNRQFTLVWDWGPKQSDRQDHSGLFVAEDLPDSKRLDRMFNTARILDDIESPTALLQLLKDRPSPSDYGLMERHLVLLQHVCAHWGAYVVMKRYLTTVRWCFWCLNAPINLDCLLDYWSHEGYLGPDLYDIILLDSTRHHREKLLPSGYMSSRWTYEPFEEDLFPILFPTFQPPMTLDRVRDYQQEMVSPHNSRYLMRLVLCADEPLKQPSDTVLDKLCRDPVLVDKYHMYMALLSEHNSAQIPIRRAVRDAVFGIADLPNYNLLMFLLCEVIHSSLQTRRFLETLILLVDSKRYDFRGLRYQFIVPNVDKFTRYVSDISLCKLESFLWTQGSGNFTSTLEFLYDTLSLFTAQHRERERWDLSIHKTAEQYSVDALARWIQASMLDVIYTFEHRNDRPFRNEWDYSPPPSPLLGPY